MSSDLKALQRTATRAGWRVEVTRHNHLRWKSPDGKHVYFTASTPSDHRAIRNIRSELRKRGLEC